MATATAMYHSRQEPAAQGHARQRDAWTSCAASKRRRLHKAFLRYHDANNWPLLREALKAMGRADLIGNGKHHLVPTCQPVTDGSYESARRKNSTPGAAASTGPRADAAHRPAAAQDAVSPVQARRRALGRR